MSVAREVPLGHDVGPAVDDDLKVALVGNGETYVNAATESGEQNFPK